MSTVEEIKRDILLRTKIGVLNTRERIYGVIERCLQQYYGEYKPSSYIRTEQLLKSLVRESDFDGLGFEVYFDAGRLNYENGVMELLHTPQSGMYGWATWGADEVLDTAMHGSHGGYAQGVAIWDDSMADLGDILLLIRRELIAAGLPIK